MRAENHVALVLFGRILDGETVGYTEEIHLLTAESQAEAGALALARGRAQETHYFNAEGQPCEYRLLRVVDVQPYLFGNEAEAIYTRSFDQLSAYHEVATLRGPLPGDLVTAQQLPALAGALSELFGPPLTAQTEADGLGFLWRGRNFGSFGTVGMEQETFALMALFTAHDVVLAGMGEDGDHPGELVAVQCEVQPVPEGWLLRLLTPNGGEVRQALWPLI